MSTRIRGKKLSLTLGSPGVPVWQDVKSWTLAAEDLDGPTFGEIANGGAAWKLSGTGIQSNDTGSFWEYVWANAGKDVAFTVAPHGNEVATATQPHYAGTLNIGKKPSIGGDAGSSGYEFDFEFEVVGEPVKDVGA